MNLRMEKVEANKLHTNVNVIVKYYQNCNISTIDEY